MTWSSTHTVLIQPTEDWKQITHTHLSTGGCDRFRVISRTTVFSRHGGHVEAVTVDFWDGPLWSETNGQPLRRTRTQEGRKKHHWFWELSLCSHTYLLQGARGPHQLVDHVDGDPHEGGEANEVPHRDAPVGVLVVKQGQLWHLQEGADDDELRRRRRYVKIPVSTPQPPRLPLA